MRAERVAQDLAEVLERAAGDFEAFRNARIFITGGTGFVGTWLLEALCYADDRLALNANLCVLTRDPERFASTSPHLAQHRSVTLTRGDVTELPASIGTFDGVVHAATPASAALNRERPMEMLDTITIGGRHALELAARSGPIPFLFTSSGAVYGPQDPSMLHVPESYQGAPDVLTPGNAYSEGKRLGELQCALFSRAHNIQAKIARLFAFVGPYLPLDRHFAIGNFIGDALGDRDVLVQGDGTTVRSYLYASEMIVWLLAVYARGEALRAYNIGSEEAVTIASLAKRVVESSRDGSRVKILGKAEPGRKVDRYVPSSLRIRNELGVEQRIFLDKAIRRTIEFHRSAAAKA